MLHSEYLIHVVKTQGIATQDEDTPVHTVSATASFVVFAAEILLRFPRRASLSRV